MRALIGLIVVSFVCFCGHAQQRMSLEQELGQVMKEYHAVGISAVVVRDGNICYSNAFGYNPDYNDTTLRKPIPENGVYWLASVSKTFVSTAIMQLVEKRKVRLDEDVNRYLPFRVCNPYYEDVPITVRMLLCHRSSINDKYYGRDLAPINPQKSDKWKECYNGDRPGDKYFYCNLNYSLLAVIIEQVSGMRFDEYIDRRITGPLGLDASFNLTRIDSTRLVKSLNYDSNKKRYKLETGIYDYARIRDALAGYRLGESTASLAPAGGMRISSTDLAHWMMVHMHYGKFNGKRILRKKSELTMWAPQGPETQYGLAFSHYDHIVKGESFIGMKGGSHGINSVFVFNPEKKYGFVVICNGHVPKEHGRSINDQIIRVLYKHFIQ